MPARITLPHGVTLDVIEQGSPSGTPVVLLHGYTDSCRSYEPVLAQLPGTIRALAPTQRGHGDSSRPETYRIVDFSEDLRAAMDVLQLPAAVIVGHSMGSLVAQRFAIDHPSRVLGLVLVGAFTTLKGHPGVQELWDGAVSTLTDPVDPDFIREFQQSTLAREVPAAFFETVVAESAKVPARVWRAACQEFLAGDFSTEINRIAAPTLVLWGDQDVFCAKHDQETLRDSIPGARLVVLGGGGHALHWEDPGRFAVDLVAFALSCQR